MLVRAECNLNVDDVLSDASSLRQRLRTIIVCGTTSTTRYETIVPPITPSEPIRCTHISDNARFTAAATIDSTACARMRFNAANRHDSTVINPLISAHRHMAASNGHAGTAAAPAHNLINPRPN